MKCGGVFCTLGVVLVCASGAGAAEFALPRDSRVVFLGDALTEQNAFPELVEAYVRVAYPENRTRFFRFARSGATPASLTEIFQKDVRNLQPAPTHVVVCAGPYSVGLRALTDEESAAFRTGLDALVRRILDAEMRVILVTPPSADLDRNPRYRQLDFNTTTLGPIAEIIRETAKSHQATLIDWFTVSTEQRTLRQEKDPNFSFSRDGLRPQSEGNALAASLLLEHWNAKPLHGTITLDWETAELTSDLEGVTAEKVDENQVKLVFRDFPMGWALSASRGEQVTADWYACRLCTINLRVKGLPAQGVLVVPEGRQFPLMRKQLEEGYNLAASKVFTEAPEVSRLMRLIVTKNKLFTRRWIDQEAKKPAEPELKEAFETLMKAYDLYHAGYVRMIDQAPRRVSLEFTLKALDQPGGALGKKPDRRRSRHSSEPGSSPAAPRKDRTGGGTSDGGSARTPGRYASADLLQGGPSCLKERTSPL